MEELKSLEEVKQELNIKDINFDLSKQEELPEEKPQEQSIVEELHKQAMVEVVKNDTEVQAQIVDKAKESINTELDILDKKEEARLQEAHYDANKEACNNYGVDSSVPIWQVKMMKIGSSVWFCVYWIFATLVICPINVFVKALRSFIKNGWIVIIVAILIYLVIVVGIPLLIKLIPTI